MKVDGDGRSLLDQLYPKEPVQPIPTKWRERGERERERERKRVSWASQQLDPPSGHPFVFRPVAHGKYRLPWW